MAHKTPVAHATTTGMTGDGFYNTHSAPQWSAIEAVLPWLDEAVQGLPEAPLVLADFGCSEGQNSIRVMSRAVQALLDRQDGPIQTIHSDLPTNDFSHLFLALGDNAFGSDRVFSAAVGGSMFDQLLPPGSLSLATTFNAIGFLSEKPLTQLPGYILPNGPSALGKNGFVSETDRASFADRAHQDVAAFLSARAAELRPGGKLLVQVFGCTDEARTCDGIYDVLHDAVRDYVASGDISQAVYDASYHPVYFRTLDELTAPAEAASDLFTLDRAQAYEVPVPFNDAYAETGDLGTYAQAYVDFFRAFTEAVLVNSLPDTPDRTALVDRIYARAVDWVKADPEAYPFRYAALAMVLTRA